MIKKLSLFLILSWTLINAYAEERAITVYLLNEGAQASEEIHVIEVGNHGWMPLHDPIIIQPNEAQTLEFIVDSERYYPFYYGQLNGPEAGGYYGFQLIEQADQNNNLLIGFRNTASLLARNLEYKFVANPYNE